MREPELKKSEKEKKNTADRGILGQDLATTGGCFFVLHGFFQTFRHEVAADH